MINRSLTSSLYYFYEIGFTYFGGKAYFGLTDFRR